MAGYYILEGHVAVPCEDMDVWGNMFKSDMRVCRDSCGDIEVSTVFLGIDHNHSDEGPPLLFETMTFTDGREVGCERWSTWEEAEKGHDVACTLAFGHKALAEQKVIRDKQNYGKLVDNMVDRMMADGEGRPW